MTEKISSDTISTLWRNAGIGKKGDIGVKEYTRTTEKKGGGVEVTTIPKLLCDRCGKNTGRHIDGQTDSVVCPYCNHRVR